MSLNNKEIKESLRKKAFTSPEKYYPTDTLKELGYIKNHCKKCRRIFYTIGKKDVCGDPACFGGFKFIGNTPAKNKLDYIEAWTAFARIMKKRGYTPIDRYPSVARWRDDEYWVGASIYNFQPYVVSGEVQPPANPLVVPQFCLRFNDVDNVGITGAHYTGFIMQGQHAFVRAKEYDKDTYFKDLHHWFIKGIGVPKEELYILPDSWAGGGNAGVSCEFFSRGIEIANQVYMQYEVTPNGLKELNLKVLDMGQGQERVAWFSQGKSTSYETTFPSVMTKLRKVTGVSVDDELMKKFLPYSSYLNVDEVDSVEKTWDLVAKKVGLNTGELKQNILPLAGLYSVAEHSRSLLFALSDSALPSNTGGGYNLRVILRRALSFIDQYGWKISLPDICDWHASYLKPLFPELSENLEEVRKILEVEQRKFKETKQKTSQLIGRIVKSHIDEKKLLQLYDSQGITPEMMQEASEKHGKKITVPDNFYARVSELHEKKEQATATKKEDKLPLEGIPPTKALYFDDYKKNFNKAKVLKIIGNNVILDTTIAYPTSGGQIHDIGTIDDNTIHEVTKQGSVIVHVMKDKPSFKEKDTVTVAIDLDRRQQLAQHHTSTHIVNAAAQKVLGNHINQAGAKKTKEKATLDITHYQALSKEELKTIEKEANHIVSKKIPVKKSFMPRDEAEKKFGMRIYQGGAVPGKELRIVEIADIDVEACGGTHLNNTEEAGKIKLIKSTKISDSIVRIEFKAGSASSYESKMEKELIKQLVSLLEVTEGQIPDRAKELFEKWKKARKAVKKKKELPFTELELTSKTQFKGDVIAETAKILKTQPEHLSKTISRLKKELDHFKEKFHA